MRRALLLFSAAMMLSASAVRGDVDSPTAGSVVLSPQDLEWQLWNEWSRRQPLGGLGAPGRGEAGWPLRLSTAADPDEAFCASRLRGSLIRPGLDVPGVWVRPEWRGIAWGADPARQLRPEHADVRDGDDVDPALRSQLSLRLRARLTSAAEAYFRFRLDSDGRNDTLGRTRDFPQLGASNNVDEAYLRATFRRTAFTLGRMPLAWGPSLHGSLLLSATAPAMDLLHLNLRWRSRNALQAFAGELSTETVTIEDDATPMRRFLYGHRGDVWITRWLRLGLSEVALVAGPRQSLSLKFLNPVQFYAQAQTEEDGEDEHQVNVLEAVDAEAFVGPVHLYGSLVVDDFQIDASGRERTPDQLAWAAGATFAPSPGSPWWAGLELRRIGSWVGLHDGAGTDYRHFGRPLGATEGPDTDRQLAFLSRWLGRGDRIRLDVERRRRGINRILTEESRTGHAGEGFPRGAVEHRWSLRGSLEHWIGAIARLRAEIAWHTIDGLNNGPEDLDLWEAQVTLDLRGPSVRWQPRSGD